MKLTVPPPLLRGWHGSVRQVHLVADMVVGRGQGGTMSCRGTHGDSVQTLKGGCTFA